MVTPGGVELEALCGRLSPQPKSWASAASRRTSTNAWKTQKTG